MLMIPRCTGPRVTSTRSVLRPRTQISLTCEFTTLSWFGETILMVRPAILMVTLLDMVIMLVRRYFLLHEYNSSKHPTRQIS